VAFAMLGSFLLSRTFVPVLCAKWLTAHEPAHGGHSGGFFRAIDQALHFLTRRYERLLGLALRHRLPVLGLVGLLFVASVALLPRIGREFFPQVDAGQMVIYVRSPPGVSLDESERRVIQVEEFLKEHIPARERRKIIAELGVVPDWSSAYTPNSG